MKISFDGELIYEISEQQIKSLCHKINKKSISKAIKDKIRIDIQSFCDQALDYLKKQWLPILCKRYESIPTSDEKLINLILSQPDYEDEYYNQMKIKMQNDQRFVIQ